MILVWTAIRARASPGLGCRRWTVAIPRVLPLLFIAMIGREAHRHDLHELEELQPALKTRRLVQIEMPPAVRSTA